MNLLLIKISQGVITSQARVPRPPKNDKYFPLILQAFLCTENIKILKYKKKTESSLKFITFYYR